MRRFRDIAGYFSKVADFDPPHLHLAPPQGVIAVEFRGDLWQRKTRFPGLSCGVVCVILCLALLVELRLVTDGQTEGQTDGHRAMASTADAYTVASRGKKLKYTEAILSNSTQKLLWFEITKMHPDSSLRKKIHSVIHYNFRHTFVPCNNGQTERT